jgi:hypothetical protein
VTENKCWIGFSRLRPTRLEENLSWVRHGFRDKYLPTRITLYDFEQNAVLDNLNVEPYGLHAIFSILNVDEQTLGTSRRQDATNASLTASNL